MNHLLSVDSATHADPGRLRGLPRMLLGIFTLGAAGTAAELLLIGHFEDRNQTIPLFLLGIALAAAAWLALRPGRLARRSFQGLMAAFLTSGLLGVGLHYQANQEFELEMYPDMAGVELLQETLTGALPVLAPGTMILLGLVGLSVTHRNPDITRPLSEDDS